MSVYEEWFDDLTLWPYWDSRFADEYPQFITPNNERVREAVIDSGAQSEKSPQDKALACWYWVWKNIDYSLSLEWKEPEQTIEQGAGDCEDVTFLIASMLSNQGVTNTQVVAGYLKKPQSPPEAHTWNSIGRMVVDGTGSPSDIEELTYEQEFAYTIQLQ